VLISISGLSSLASALDSSKFISSSYATDSSLPSQYVCRTWNVLLSTLELPIASLRRGTSLIYLTSRSAITFTYRLFLAYALSLRRGVRYEYHHHHCTCPVSLRSSLDIDTAYQTQVIQERTTQGSVLVHVPMTALLKCVVVRVIQDLFQLMLRMERASPTATAVNVGAIEHISWSDE
jgi:hypothetical protein